MGVRSNYLKELLCRYQASFDVTENYKLGDTLYPAYARFHSLSEKYVLKKEATLWSINAYEHVLFIKEERLNEEKVSSIMRAITEYAEPELVRNNSKYPEKDHMCTYLTFVVLTSNDNDVMTSKYIRKFHYDKGYLFNFRGHCEARLAVVSMESGQIITNRTGKDLRKLLEDVYDKTVGVSSPQTKAAADSSILFS